MATAVASVCAVLCLGAVVWSTYAAFDQKGFDLQQSVLRSVDALAAVGTAAPPAHPDAAVLAHAQGHDAGHVAR